MDSVQASLPIPSKASISSRLPLFCSPVQSLSNRKQGDRHIGDTTLGKGKVKKNINKNIEKWSWSSYVLYLSRKLITFPLHNVSSPCHLAYAFDSVPCKPQQHKAEMHHMVKRNVSFIINFLGKHMGRETAVLNQKRSQIYFQQKPKLNIPRGMTRIYVKYIYQQWRNLLEYLLAQYLLLPF